MEEIIQLMEQDKKELNFFDCNNEDIINSIKEDTGKNFITLDDYTKYGKENIILFLVMKRFYYYYLLCSSKNNVLQSLFTLQYYNNMSVIYDEQINTIKKEINDIITNYENSKWKDNAIMEILTNVKIYINDDINYDKKIIQNTFQIEIWLNTMPITRKSKDFYKELMKCFVSIIKLTCIDNLKIGDLVMYRYPQEIIKITDKYFYLEQIGKVKKNRIICDFNRQARTVHNIEKKDIILSFFREIYFKLLFI